MKHQRSLMTALLFSGLLASAGALAGDGNKHEKHMIMVKTDGADVIEADVSNMEIGESKAWVTESGRAVDLIKTADGMELYIDGELQDLGLDGGLHDADHVVMHEDIEVECHSDVEGECDNHFVFYGNDGDAEHNVMVIKEKVEIICDDEDNCEEMVWISEDGEDINIERLHEAGDHDVKVIKIKKHVETSSAD